VVVTTVLVMLASGRLFQWSLLQYGKRPGPRALLAALDSNAFRTILRDLPGYTAPQTLQILDVRALSA